jgi:hypothetical protein
MPVGFRAFFVDGQYFKVCDVPTPPTTPDLDAGSWLLWLLARRLLLFLERRTAVPACKRNGALVLTILLVNGVPNHGSTQRVNFSVKETNQGIPESPLGQIPKRGVT